MTIRIKSISFRYGLRPALKSVDFSLKSGRFYALLGPNGAGKSTLFSLITRINALQEGDIKIDDVSIKTHPSQLMQRIGVVFQQSTLDLDLSVMQNLQYHAALHGFSKEQASKQADQELKRLNLLDRKNDKVRTLNGGHRRRVEIARALLHQPSLLLLDEPTVGLDPQARRSINEHVRSLCDEQGITVLWATHLMEEIKANDNVLLLNNGQLQLNGKAEDLIKESGATNYADAFHVLTSSLLVES